PGHRRNILLEQPHNEEQRAENQDQRSHDLKDDHEVPAGFRTSTMRTPELCSTMMISPLPTTHPFREISKGSPAGFLISSTVPALKRRNSPTARRRRPTSMETFKGMS